MFQRVFLWEDNFIIRNEKIFFFFLITMTIVPAMLKADISKLLFLLCWFLFDQFMNCIFRNLAVIVHSRHKNKNKTNQRKQNNHSLENKHDLFLQYEIQIPSVSHLNKWTYCLLNVEGTECSNNSCGLLAVAWNSITEISANAPCLCFFAGISLVLSWSG